MITVTDTRGGYLLRRDDEPQAAPLFVSSMELAPLIAELLSRETTADAWDMYAFLCGNDQIAPTRTAVRP